MLLVETVMEPHMDGVSDAKPETVKNVWMGKRRGGELARPPRSAGKQRLLGRSHPEVISSPPLLAQGLIPVGIVMRIGRQVFWLRGHSLPFRPSRFNGLKQWRVVWKEASPVTAAQPLPNCPFG
jgi:hypothetical protein